MRSILVTGANRSGTTWVGEMLALSRRILWIYEPFNWQLAPPRIAGPCPFPTHFHAVTAGDDREAERYIRRRLLASLASGRSFEAPGGGRAGAALRALGAIPGCLTGRRRALIKDPTALMSAEWMAERFGSRIVIVVRHPGAYVASIMRVDWPMNPETLLDQKAVTDRLPADLVDAARRYTEGRTKRPGFDLRDTAWFWTLLYAEVDRLRTAHPDWILVRHEDLSLDYLAGFRELYSEMGLPWNDGVEERISDHCRRGNVKDPGSEIMVLKRDSLSTVTRWKDVLGEDDIAVVRDITAGVSDRFYDGSWWDRTDRD